MGPCPRRWGYGASRRGGSGSGKFLRRILASVRVHADVELAAALGAPRVGTPTATRFEVVGRAPLVGQARVLTVTVPAAPPTPGSPAA